MEKKHIVKSYDEELDLLRLKISEMGKKAYEQLARAMDALMKRDDELANEIIKDDIDVNALQAEVNDLTISMLAKRQPLAIDLRLIVSALKMATDLERIADYAKNIAKHVFDLNHLTLDEPNRYIISMCECAFTMLEDAMDAFHESDEKKAVKVWQKDSDIDEEYTELLIFLHNIMSRRPENTKAFTALLFVARCCERIGDHITNLAESVYYTVTGTSYPIIPPEVS